MENNLGMTEKWTNFSCGSSINFLPLEVNEKCLTSKLFKERSENIDV